MISLLIAKYQNKRRLQEADYHAELFFKNYRLAAKWDVNKMPVTALAVRGCALQLLLRYASLPRKNATSENQPWFDLLRALGIAEQLYTMPSFRL